MTRATAAPRTKPAIARIVFDGVMPVVHSYTSVAAVGSAARMKIVLAGLKPCATFDNAGLEAVRSRRRASARRKVDAAATIRAAPTYIPVHRAQTGSCRDHSANERLAS